jgi:predicted acyl esterase
LKGVDTGIMKEPAYRVWMQESVPPKAYYTERPGRWVAEPSWPSAAIAERRLFFARGRLTDTPGAKAQLTLSSPQDTGEAGGAWCSFGLGPDMPTDQRIDDGNSLVFDSEPLPERMEILGAPIVTLDLAADKPNGFVCVRLNDVRPDGASARVTYGLLNLTHRESHESPRPLVPGERVRVTLRLNDIAHAFPAGSRIRIAVSNAYWPLAWPSPAPVAIALHAKGCYLDLPVRPPREDDAKLRQFPESEAASPLKKTYHRPARYERTIERDVASGEVVQRVIDDSGAYTIGRIGLDYELVQEEVSRIRPDDPLSARIDVSYTMRIGRGDWRTRSETRTRMQATASEFVIDASLDAYEGDTRIVARNWSRRIKRDLV